VSRPGVPPVERRGEAYRVHSDVRCTGVVELRGHGRFPQRWRYVSGSNYVLCVQSAIPLAVAWPSDRTPPDHDGDLAAMALDLQFTTLCELPQAGVKTIHHALAADAFERGVRPRVALGGMAFDMLAVTTLMPYLHPSEMVRVGLAMSELSGGGYGLVRVGTSRACVVLSALPELGDYTFARLLAARAVDVQAWQAPDSGEPSELFLSQTPIGEA